MASYRYSITLQKGNYCKSVTPTSASGTSEDLYPIKISASHVDSSAQYSYKFAGWEQVGGGTIIVKDSSSETTYAGGSGSLKANYKRILNEYTVSYDLNGGKGASAPSSITDAYGAKIFLASIPSGVYKQEKSNYDNVTFSFDTRGGSSAPSRTGTNYTLSTYNHSGKWSIGKPGDEYEIRSNVTAYLQWNSSPTEAHRVYDSTYLPSRDECRRTGYYLKGWTTSSTSTTAMYEPGQKLTTESDTKFFAIWEELCKLTTHIDDHVSRVTLTYKPYSGASDVEIYVTSDSTVTYIAKSSTAYISGTSIVCKTGYHLLQSESTLSVTLTSTQTSAGLYVFTEANKYTITYSGNGATRGQGPSENPVTYTYDDSSKTFPSYGYNKDISFIFHGNSHGTYNNTSTKSVTRVADPQGWRIVGSTKIYYPGDTVLNVTSVNDARLTADVNWSAESYTLTESDEPSIRFQMIDIAEFDHFNTKSDDTGTSYLPGSTVSTYGSIDLYAIWRIQTYKLSWSLKDDANPQGFDRCVITYSNYSRNKTYTVISTSPSGSIDVEYNGTYKIDFYCKDGYESTPSSKTGSIGIGGTTVVYQINPKKVFTLFKPSHNNACKIYVDGVDYTNRSLESYVGVKHTITFTQDAVQQSRYTWYGWADKNRVLLTYSKTLSYTVDVNNTIVYATFDGNFTLTARASTGGGIRVNKETSTETYINRWYSPDTIVRLEAVPEDGYTFTGWNDGVKDAYREVKMDGDVSLSAHFSKKRKCVIDIVRPASAIGDKGLYVSAKWGAGDNQGITGRYEIDTYEGDSIRLVWFISPGKETLYKFSRWTRIDAYIQTSFREVDIGSTKSVDIAMPDGDIYVYAYFEDLSYDITLTRTGYGHVAASTTIQHMQTWYNEGTIWGLKPNTTIDFYATSLPPKQIGDKRYRFLRWKIYDKLLGKTTYNAGSYLEDGRNMLTLTATTDYVVTAEFVSEKFRVNVAIAVYGGNGVYNGELPDVGCDWVSWRSANYPYYESGASSGLGGQCTWFAHGRTAQMRGNRYAGAPYGDGTSSSSEGYPNAEDWPFRSSGHWTGTKVEVGSAAVWPTINHVGVVEAMDGDHVYVSNWNAGYGDLNLRFLGTTYKPITYFTYVNNNIDTVIDITRGNEDSEDDTDNNYYETSSAAGHVEIDGGVRITDATHEYMSGEVCDISAYENDAWEFAGWTHNGDTIEDRMFSFEVNEDTQGTYIAVFYNKYAGGEGGELEPPSLEDMEYICTTYYYLYEADLGSDYWNYKYQKWLNLGDKNVYEVVEYIESDDKGQGINALYGGNRNINVTIDGQFLDTRGPQMHGLMSSSNSFYCGIGTNGNFVVKTFEEKSAKQADASRHVFTIGGLSSSVDGTSLDTGTIFGTTSSLWLFCGGYNYIDNTVNAPCRFRLYDCKITDNGEVVRHFIPVRRVKDNVYGLWDTVYKKFYRSATYTVDENNIRTPIDFKGGKDIRRLDKFVEV